MKDDVKVSRRAPLDPGLSYSREANASAVFDSGGNLGVNRFLLYDPTFASALRAWVADHTARALACRAGPGYAEKALLVADLATSSTGPATRGGLALRASRAAARFAVLVPAVNDLSFGAEDGFLKFDSDVFAKISASLSASTASRTSTTTSKEIAKAEELAEDVAEILEDGCIEARACSGGTHSSVAEAVVQSAFLGIREHCVGLACFLEFFFRVRIVGIAVRVELHRQFSVGALNLLIAGSLLDSQHVVIIAF